MTAAAWHPVAASHELRAGENIVASFLQGAELALWRTPEGAPQAWDNRCPHRSVRFTLGQVVGDRLSCAYHGWQFQAGSGACAGIPAHPHLSPPRHVCVKTWRVAEAAGMIWVNPVADSTDAAPVDAVPAGWHFCRTLTINVPLASLPGALQALGWQTQGPVWGHAGLQARALPLDAQAGMGMLHVWTAAAPASAEMAALHAALRQLRASAEEMA
ncbi:MAG: Rieske (2Fe-2S) protein [Burkholderiales bacterium]|nr:Rieske (2Fe-2S) protein [Burkholderiales bacterium]